MVVRMSHTEPELMGIFGWSWPEKVAAFMIKRTKGTGLEKKLKKFWGASGKNTTLIKNLHREYVALLATGKTPAEFTTAPDASGNGGTFTAATETLAKSIQQRTNVDLTIVKEFLRALFVLSRDGKIPFDKWNPEGYAESKKLTKTFSTEKNPLDILKSGSGTAKTVLLIAGLGVTAYLLNSLKGFTK